MHLAIFILISIPAPLAYAFAVPIYTYKKLTKNLDLIERITGNTDNRSVKKTVLSRFKVRYGFLTEGYCSDYYYWEIVKLSEKSVIILLLTFLGPISSGVQSLTVIIVFIVYLGVYIIKKPYDDNNLNNMEHISLFVLIMTVYCGLYYQASKDEKLMQTNFVKWSLFIIVLASSLIFAIYFFFKMRIEILKVCA